MTYKKSWANIFVRTKTNSIIVSTLIAINLLYPFTNNLENIVFELLISFIMEHRILMFEIYILDITISGLITLFFSHTPSIIIFLLLGFDWSVNRN